MRAINSLQLALKATCIVQPTWPFGRGAVGRKPPPFFAVDAEPGILVAIVMGLQHALAMVGGIITPPLLVYRVTVPMVRKSCTHVLYLSP